MERPKTTGDRLRDIRVKAGEIQQETADALGVKRETVRNWETDVRPLKADTIIKLAAHFHVSADYLLGIVDERTQDIELQQVCSYTGLPQETIEYLHAMTVAPEYRSINARLISDILLLNGGVTVELSKLLSQSALARAAEDVFGDSGRKNEITNTLNKMQGMNSFAITAKEASEFFLSRAVSLLTSHIAEMLSDMRDDRCKGYQTEDKPIEHFDWYFVGENHAKEK